MTDQGQISIIDFFAGYDIRPTKTTRHAELDAAFREFHEANPDVWRLFVRFTFDVIRRGFKHYSSKSIFERIRWHTDIETVIQTGEIKDFKLNNNYTAAYARLFGQTYPEHAGFFRLRKRTSKSRPARGESCGS